MHNVPMESRELIKKEKNILEIRKLIIELSIEDK